MPIRCPRGPGRPIAALAAALLAVSSTPAVAEESPWLLFDLRAQGSSTKEVLIEKPGERVALRLYVTIRGDDPDLLNEGLWSGFGSFRSSAGGLSGNLEGLKAPGPFDAMPADPGRSADLDGDGDLDVGGLDPRRADGFYHFRAPQPVRPMPAGGYLVGLAEFTVTSSGTGSTEINWFPRTNPLSDTVLFQRDGEFVSLNGDSSLMGVGEPVRIVAPTPSLPEPATLGLLGIVAVAAIGRQRRITAAH